MRAAITAVLGVVTIIGAFAFLLLSPGSATDSPLQIALAVLVGIVGFIGALVKIGTTETDDAVASAPWDESGALVERAPERSPGDYDLSGERLAGVVEGAGETARDEGTVAAGVEVVRPDLRDALVGVLVQGGTDRATAERMLAQGTWTDDATAAAALDERVDHPGWSFLKRFEAWLFPEQVVRREVQESMQAIAEAADRELPIVPGQHAPRTVPVLKPTLEDLRRGADGHLQRAVDPLSARTGSDVDGATVVGDAATTVDDTASPGDGRDQEPGNSSGDPANRENDADAGSANGRRRSATDSIGDVQIGGGSEERDGGEVTRG